MTTASPPGYSRLFATGLFLSTEILPTAAAPSSSRSATPTPSTTAPQTPMLELAPPIAPYTGSTTLAVPPFSSSRATRRPNLAALRTHSTKTASSGSGPPSAGPKSGSVPSSPRVLRRRKSSVTLAHNPITAIKSPTRSAGMSSRTQSVLQSLGSPVKEKRAWSLDVVGERSLEGIEVGQDGKSAPARSRRAVVARKPPPTTPLPALPIQPPLALPTLTLNTSFPSPLALSPALTPSPNVLPAPTPGAVDLGLHKFSFASHAQAKLAAPRPARSPLVSVSSANADARPGYFDIPMMRASSPLLPENENESRMEVE
ncbi:hypothetical protein FS749_003611 [Ceratobasidium sp. UAMH 11750]|nr:hypothetical protein FS749_003611 [Ceratobasidium sp. UAMH 11750]